MSDLARFWPDWLPAALRDRLEQAYGDARRGYHDRQHLTEVLTNADELLPGDAPVREAVLLAAWFHDAVHEGQPDDEERSAALAETALTEAGAPAPLVAEVARLVRLTTTHRPAPDDDAGQVLCDADLAVLAADDARYASYVSGVRREYAHVDPAAFAAGRAAVLRDLLAKPTLFHTEPGRQRWEARARANVTAEVARLTGDGADAEAADRSGAALCKDAYAALAAVVRAVDEEQSWEPTGCRGWAVRDLVLHCLGDARRALVALHTPAAGPADRDAVTYWQDWAPDPVGAAQGRRHVRVSAGLYLHWADLQEEYLQTAAAAVHAGTGTDPSLLVATQGHTLSADALLRTLAVEAVVHHLDLVVGLPDAPGPTATGLGEVRRTLDGLLGHPAPGEVADERYALLATGRAAPTPEEQAALGADLQRFPLFS